MISEFQDLSDKINRLAELTHSLRRENAALRQANAVLTRENAGYEERLGEAHRRVAALLATLPPEARAEIDNVIPETPAASAAPQADEAAQ